jgi:hypothetical protein
LWRIVERLVVENERWKAKKMSNPAVCALIRQLKKLRRAWPTIILLAFALESTLALAQEPKQPSFGFVDASAVTISPDGSDRFRLDVAIKNSGTKEGETSLKLLSDMDKKCGQATIAAEPDAVKLSPNAIAIAHVTISGVKPPATCYVTFAAGPEQEKEQGNAALKQIRLTQQYITSTMSRSLYACILLSVLVAIITWKKASKLEGGAPASYPLGSPAWDFAKSWISTTTLASAAIAAALTLSALPDLTRYASKSGYAALAMLVSLAVVVAPFVFVAFRAGAIGKDSDGNATVVYEGCLWLFLVSGAITLFAGLAQVVVLFLLLDEIFLEYDFWSFSSDHQPWLSLNVGFVSTVALFVALCRYVSHSMLLTIELQKQADKANASNASVETETTNRELSITKRGRSQAARVKSPLTWQVM